MRSDINRSLKKKDQSLYIVWGGAEAFEGVSLDLDRK